MPALKQGTIFNTPDEDAVITAAAMSDPDAHPYTEEEWAKVKIMRGRPSLTTPKKHINLRVDESILNEFKSTGKGWQTRMNDALKEWLKTHPLAKH